MTDRPKHRPTPAQRRVMAALAAGGIVRRRGAFGEHQAALDDPRFAASITIDILWRNGLIRPAASWGAYEATPALAQQHASNEHAGRERAASVGDAAPAVGQVRNRADGSATEGEEGVRHV